MSSACGRIRKTRSDRVWEWPQVLGGMVPTSIVGIHRSTRIGLYRLSVPAVITAPGRQARLAPRVRAVRAVEATPCFTMERTRRRHRRGRAFFPVMACGQTRAAMASPLEKTSSTRVHVHRRGFRAHVAYSQRDSAAAWYCLCQPFSQSGKPLHSAHARIRGAVPGHCVCVCV